MKYAGFWIRLVADLVDGLILTIVSWVLEYALLGGVYLVMLFWKSRQGVEVPSFGDAFDLFTLQILNTGVYFCIAFPYYVWGHYKYGTTLGKKPLRIYVVQAGTGAPLTLNQSIGRFFGYGLSYAIFVCGFFMAAFHPEKRALHDVLSGTVSIRRERRKNDAEALV